MNPRQLRRATRVYGPLLLPVGLDEALQARRIFQARGLQVQSLLHARRAYLSRVHLLPPDLSLEDRLIVDVGANEGNFSAAVLSLAPGANVIAIEPNPEPRERMRARLGEGVEIVAKAVGAETGMASFNVTREDHNSSLRVPRTEQMVGLTSDSGWEVERRIEVEVTTLDELVGSREVGVVKIDVQGAEMDVLSGGRSALSRTSAVLLEVTFFSHYESDSIFGALHEEMTGQGFDLVAMSHAGRTPDGRSAWADACYARRGT